jgi:beta-N-acetylhexosaminidase
MGRIVAWIAGIVIVAIAASAVALWFFTPARPAGQIDPNFRIYTAPSIPAELQTPQAHVAVSRLATSTLDERIRSLLIVSKPGTDGAQLEALLKQSGAAGFILMKPNVPATQSQLRTLTSTIAGNPDFPRLIAIDEEGGDVTRLPYDNYPGANTLRFSPPAASTAAFTQRANLLTQVGVNFNFGIVADIASDPSSFIYSRSYGATGVSAGDRVAAAVIGEKTTPVLSTLKHFPGHGAAPGDSHSSIPSTTMSKDAWAANEAIPFKMGIETGAPAVMFGHLAYRSVDVQPASLSAQWHSILRTELKFTGLAVTDDMLMLQRSGVAEFSDVSENAIRAIAAGNDILLYVLGDDPASSGVNIDLLVSSVAAAVSTGRIPEGRINEAALRALTTRRALSSQASTDPQACNIGCTIGYSLLFPQSAHT